MRQQYKAPRPPSLRVFQVGEVGDSNSINMLKVGRMILPIDSTVGLRQVANSVEN